MVSKKFKIGQDVLIGCAANDDFARHLAVMIYSMLANTRSPERIKILVVDGGIAENKKNRITEIVNSFGAKIEFTAPDMSLFKGLKAYNHLGIEAYYRFSLIEMEEIKKILYLDSDLVIEKDVLELYEKNIEGLTIIAVRDSGISDKKKESLSIRKDKPYFNSGVMLVDCVKWRKKKVTQKSISYLLENPDKIDFADQDALNVTLKNDWKEIDASWNFVQKNLAYKLIPSFLYSRYFSEERMPITRGKKIIHYAGFFKPWFFIDPVLYKKKYVSYFKKLKWPDKVFLDCSVKGFWRRLKKDLRKIETLLLKITRA